MKGTLFEAYRILGLFPGATWSEIRTAYRRLCRDFHPDLQPEAERCSAGERMRAINGAYGRLRSHMLGRNALMEGRPEPRRGGVGPTSSVSGRAGTGADGQDSVRALFNRVMQLLGSASGFFGMDEGTPEAGDRLVYERAVTELRQLYGRCTSIDEKSDCVYYIALCQINLGKYDKALNNLHYLIEKYAESERAPFARFYLGLVHLRMGSFTEAESEFGRFLRLPGLPASFLGIAKQFRDKARQARFRARADRSIEFGA